MGGNVRDWDLLRAWQLGSGGGGGGGLIGFYSTKKQ
jgi:hypothetical protein